MSEASPRPPDRRPAPAAGASAMSREETRRDADAAYAARLELGPQFEESIAAGLADRVEQLAAYRTAELRTQSDLARTQAEQDKSGRTQRFVLGLASLGVGIPVTGIAAGTDLGLVGMVVGWAGIVGVNAVHAWGSRSRGR